MSATRPSLTTLRPPTSVGSALIVAWFLVIIAVPLVAFVAGVRPASVENRVLSPAPDIVPGRAFDARLYEEVGDWFEDRLPGRDHAVEADAWIDYHVYGDSPNPRVLLGADGWLFLADGVRAECITPQRAGDVADELALAARAGAAAGLDVVLLVAPDKAAVYPDHLGGLADDAACAAANRSLLRAALARSAAFVDTWSVLGAGRGVHDELLYYRTDTHWTRLGAAVGAEALLERLAPGIWESDSLIRTGTQRRHGDLVALMGLSFTEEAVTHRVWRGASPDVTRVETGGGPEAVVSRMAGVAVVPGEAVLVHDSMGEVIVPLLRPYFEHLTSVRTRTPSSFGIGGRWFGDLLGTADVLVFQTVERELSDRFDGSVAHRVIAALTDRLPHVEIPAGEGSAATADMPATRELRFLVVFGGGAVRVQAGESTLDAPASPSGAAVLDVSGLSGRVAVATETAPARLVLVTVP